MTGEDFSAWMDHMGFNVSEVRRVLGLSRNTIDKYRAGGAPDYIAFACAALAAGLPKWCVNAQA